ncbi:related to ferric reductase, NADH/NADPH oxidase and related proteins [Rhynchosporium agropyri]|uniref:ferric-chelate reductase (NADPH) n=1 Tax=Rhynchosporium agropyri TaxID=914238 RepID=A0A1E1L553_9HELO|nr:related to ferric reductase, NADH/NADPH oxidase and related proteins [Rhynchosporium agropyri]
MDSIVARQHNHGSMAEMDMSMGSGVPDPFYMQQIFWAFVGIAIGMAVIANGLNKALYYQRISAAPDHVTAAKPKSLFFRIHATIAAISREYGYYSVPVSIRSTHIYLAPLGPSTILIGYLVLIIVCSLYGFNTEDFLQWENVGYRAGDIAICQLPLIILLAAKRNFIGYFTGLGYERLAWLHRWVARALLFTVVIHAAFFLREWGKYDYIMTKIKDDSITQKGLVAAGVLLWIIVSSAAPIRGLSYEIFVVQHILSWLGLVAATYFHVSPQNQKWLWIPLALWAFDRMVRAGYLVYINLGIFHTKSSGFLSCKATFEPLDESHTRVTISDPPVKWEAGQHLFLACHVVAPLSSHPFTISSIPSDGKIVFVVRSKKGGTKKFFKYAEKSHPTGPQNSTRTLGRSVFIDGPYSRIRPLRQFDSLLFIAGSTGATFTVPLMRDIVQQWKGQGQSRELHFDPPPGAVTRSIRFIWVVKQSSAINWFSSELDRAIRDVDNLRQDGHLVSLDISIYVTCDNSMTSSQGSIRHSPSSSVSMDEKRLITNEIYRTPSACVYCKKLIADENAIVPVCDCDSFHAATSTASDYSNSFEQSRSSIVDDRISILGGRPDVTELIQQTAEYAMGEMAVVVCGPQGLVQNTRNAAAKVSDERGVHKGTGAQGIYVHAETFGYA